MTETITMTEPFRMTESTTPALDEISPNAEAPCNAESVALAYSIALQSYELARQRWDAVDNKTQTMVAFFTTVTVAIPVVTASPGTPPRSFGLYFAFVCYLAATVVALWARHIGELRVLHPSKLYSYWLHLSEIQFKSDMISFAGDSFEENSKTIQDKATLSNVALVAYLAELILFALWALRLI